MGKGEKNNKTWTVGFPLQNCWLGCGQVRRAKWEVMRSSQEALSFPGGSDGKEPTCSAGDLGLIPGWGRSPGEANSNLLQYSCLENPTDRGSWRATVHGVAKSRTWLERLTFSLVTNCQVVIHLVNRLPVFPFLFFLVTQSLILFRATCAQSGW